MALVTGCGVTGGRMGAGLLEGVGGLGAGQLALCAAIVFLAAMLRGYTGFGFALAAVPMLALVLPPVLVVPLVLCLEIIASLLILPGLWREMDLRSVAWLTLGSLLGVPLGVHGLATLSDAVMRTAIGVVVLVSALAIGAGLRLRRRPRAGATVVIGAASGVLGGAAAMAGPPVILFYLGAGTAASVGRASLMFFFSLVDTAALGVAATAGLLRWSLLVLILACLPTLALGQAFGTRLFRSPLQRHYRAVAVIVLVIISLMALAQSLPVLLAGQGVPGP